MNTGELLAKIGKKVRNERLRLNWTQEELAEKLDMSASFVSQIERGVRSVSIETLERLSQALGVSSADLLKKDSDSRKVSETQTAEHKLQSLLKGYTPHEQEAVYQAIKYMLNQNKKLPKAPRR